MTSSTRFTTVRSLVWALALVAALSWTSGASARTEEAETYNQSADQLLKKGDLRGAVIQLRNAIQKDPEDGALRLKLAQLDLRLGELLAAEASAAAAKERGVAEEQVAPVLAEALYLQGEYGRLLKSVLAGDRAPKTESVVRMLRGLSHLSLGESANAEPMLRDAVRLDPESTSARGALVGWLLAAGKLDEADQMADAALATAPDNTQALAAKGRVLAARGDTAGALAKLGAAIERDPNNLQARLARVGLEVRQGSLDAAQQDLDPVLKRAPGSGGAVYLQALIQTARSDLKAADATLAKMGGNLGQPPESLYLAGYVKLRLGERVLAEDYLRRYVARQPNSAGAIAMLGTLALQKGDARQAIDSANRALKISPGNVEALGVLGRAYMAAGETAKALEAFEAAAKTQPENPAAQAQVALTRLNQGQTTEGIDALERIFRADDKGVAVGPMLVLQALRIGEFEKALAASEELAKRDPENILYLQLLGTAYAGNRDLPNAEAVFHRLIEKKPDLAAARRNLGEVYLSMGRNDDAKKLYDEPLKKNANDIESLLALANIDARVGQVPEAIDLLKRAQGVATNSGPGLRLVALYQSQKDLKSALKVASDLHDRFPQDLNVVDALGRTQAASGDLPGAVSTYRQALDAQPDSTPLLERYAQALFASKNYSAARDVLRHELALLPGNELVQRQIVEAELHVSGPDAAIATARSFAASDPRNPIGDILAAQVLAMNGKADDAIKLLEKTQSEKPSAKVVGTLATLYSRTSRSDRAIDLLKQWLTAHPDELAVRMALAETYLGTHAYDLARSEFETLAAARETDPTVLNNLAWLYQKAGDPRARETATKAYRLAPSPELADTLGWILTTEGGAEAGLKYLQGAGTARPQNPDIQYHLAVALQKTGKVEDARGILRKIVAQDGEFESKADARSLLSQLGG